MTLKSISAALLIAATSTSVSADDGRIANNPLVVWQGTLFVTSANAACLAAGVAVGEAAVAVFRPRLDPAEPTSGLALYFGRASLQMRRTGGVGSDKMAGAGTYEGYRFTSRATINIGFTGNYSFVLTPANPVGSTSSITLSGSIANYDGATGCTAGVRGAFTKRP